ncbi:MAG: polysaccharide biosynthesis/export family protein [Cyclobacteriaceae bacterium]
MRTSFISHSFWCILLLLFSSCYSNKRLVYLQGDEFSTTKATLVENRRQAYRLQPNDILSVQVKSSAASEISNLFNVGSLQNAMFASQGSLFLEGYSVDGSGKITLPVLGEVVVRNLTLDEVQELIQSHANKYLNNATVIVKLTSFKITVLGEVKAPGHYFVYNNQATILEGLGMAGDLTSFGNRKNVKLIRQMPAGSQVVLVNLTHPGLLQSEYFFLHPGDVLYVEPLRARTKRTNIEVMSLVFSAVTTAVLIMSFVNTN